MNGYSLLVQAMVYLAAGVVSVPIAKRLGLGSVLGYLIAGVLVGPFALDLVGPEGDILNFAEFGVVILLFLIGLEVRPALLWRMRTAIFGVGTAQLLATAALVGAGSLAFGLDWRLGLATGLILALSSTAIVLQSLEEKGTRQGPVGEASFGVLLFQDLAVIPLFALLPLLAPAGGPAAGPAHDTNLVGALPMWARVAAQLAAVAAVAVGGRYLTRPIFRFIAAARLREIFTASALLAVVAVAALMELVGLSPALGAFLAGVVLAESEFRRELETDIEPFRGLLLGLFFITVGAGLDLGLVLKHPLTIAAAVGGLIVLKTVAMYICGRLFRTPSSVALTTAVGLAQGGEFAFVLLGFAVGVHVMDAQLARLLTAVVAVSMAATPLVTAAYEKLVLTRLEERPEPENLPFDEGDPDVIVAGFGRFGQIATRLLLANNFKVVLLESSIEQIEILRRFGWRVHYGDASRIDLLRSAGADKARLLLVAIDDRDKAVEMVAAARQAFPKLAIFARAFDRRHAYELIKTPGVIVERETFESALNYGRRALLTLGLSERRANRAASLFREQDNLLWKQLAPIAGEEDRYVMATRDSRETTERVLRAEMERIAEEEDREDAPQLASVRRLEADEERV
ncbi:MAG TPA: monovalent cation:proton antiporter-2 (CPA2) family protein [Phenylobacterium sp.]|jgi:monovalent cation:proton antiporter-2 (CPA2) family protein|uniref:monovalent cation:proton antiporter-2 (CPA2) family protein n=1 Tax=Phenylobacterium sp. TaxID=1871053 RepID=UPI002B9FEA18|nr:monovalent cation:proton antiporter-2 (CPA2) family protein [Phenylobacterium sp.]HXA38292.1 monovalent cation:proton antiporter-2 (CPA2) family protein [Phenylobacterium sp.]